MSDYPIRVLGGIPAIARVIHFMPYVPATWNDPAEGPEMDWELLDSRGCKAQWIEKRITPSELEDIEIDLYEKCDEAYRNRRYADL